MQHPAPFAPARDLRHRPVRSPLRERRGRGAASAAGQGALPAHRPAPARPAIDAEEYLPLIDRLVAQARGRFGFAVDEDELRSAAALGLMEAVSRYQDSRGIPFGAFARFRIAGAILDEVRSRDSLTRPSRQRARTLETRRRELVSRLRREPTEHELARAAGESLDTFHRRSERARAQVFVSLEDLPCGWTERVAANDPDASEQLCESERQRSLRAALGRLPERTQSMLALYFDEELSYREIGGRYGVSESRICQILKGALRQVRAELEEAAA